MENIRKSGGPVAAVLLPALLLGSPLWSWAGDAPLQVFVSVLPQKFLAERIVGEGGEVHVMVGAGRSPSTYEPTPRQMARLAEADIYFRIGVPFESAWMEKLAAAGRGMKIIDSREGLPLRSLELHEEHEGEAGGGGQIDPHLWTSPPLAARIALTMKDALAREAPSRAAEFTDNYRRLARELDALDGEIRELLRGVSRRRFMVFHPSWGYFADTYGLEQVAIERGGGEPGARELAGLIDLARKEGIRVIFVQKQFSRRNAEAVAAAVGGRVIAVDPLAEDYIVNLRAVAALLAGALR